MGKRKPNKKKTLASKNRRDRTKPATNPAWRRFEIAVTSFIEALKSGAKVTHDAQIPDKQTGCPRQRDVWVEWVLGALFPVRGLISCKFWAEALNEQDIDHFNGEFQSSGAQIGIIYARTGYTDPAIQKAKSFGFHCCKLYEDQPADLPESLVLGLAYTFRPRFQIALAGDRTQHNLRFLKELFPLQTDNTTVFEMLATQLDHFQSAKTPLERWQLAKHGYTGVCNIGGVGLPPLQISFRFTWRAFQARIEYTNLNGSYNITSGLFQGSQSTPPVDMQCANPGPGWVELSEIPEAMPNPRMAIYTTGDSRQALISWGETPV